MKKLKESCTYVAHECVLKENNFIHKSDTVWKYLCIFMSVQLCSRNTPYNRLKKRNLYFPAWSLVIIRISIPNIEELLVIHMYVMRNKTNKSVNNYVHLA